MQNVFETRREATTEEDRLVERFTRRETPAARRTRIAARQVDPATAAAVRKLFAA